MSVDFIESGDPSGPTLLFAPGSYSTPSAWAGVQKALRGRYRQVATSLPGYGGSAEVRAPESASMADMTRWLRRVMDKTGSDAIHLVAHSYGGLTTLAAALEGDERIASLIGFEANPLFTKPEGDPYPWLEDAMAMYRRFEAAAAAGEPDAPGIIIDFWGHEGAFAALPEPVKAYCRATAGSNLLDWRSAIAFAPALRDYASIAFPCTLVRGEHANAAIKSITPDIVRQLPDGDEHVVAGAGHFLISTHPRECAALIDQHMGRAGR